MVELREMKMVKEITLEQSPATEINAGRIQPRFRETGLPRKGFGVPVQVAVERSNPGPIFQPCAASDDGFHICVRKTKHEAHLQSSCILDISLKRSLKLQVVHPLCCPEEKKWVKPLIAKNLQ